MAGYNYFIQSGSISCCIRCSSVLTIHMLVKTHGFIQIYMKIFLAILMEAIPLPTFVQHVFLLWEFRVIFCLQSCNLHQLILQRWFFQLVNWFQLFSSDKNIPKVAGHSQNRKKKKKGPFESGCRLFQLFSLIFSYFIF